MKNYLTSICIKNKIVLEKYRENRLEKYIENANFRKFVQSLQIFCWVQFVYLRFSSVNLLYNFFYDELSLKDKIKANFCT